MCGLTRQLTDREKNELNPDPDRCLKNDLDPDLDRTKKRDRVKDQIPIPIFFPAFKKDRNKKQDQR